MALDPADGLKELGIASFVAEDKSGWCRRSENAPSSILPTLSMIARSRQLLNPPLGGHFDAFQEIITATTIGRMFNLQLDY